MRNLKLLNVVELSDVNLLNGCSFLSVDCDTNYVYGVTPDGRITLYDPNSQQIVAGLSLVDSGFLPGDGFSHVAGTHYLPDQMSLCVATSGGDILLCNLNSNQVECVGSVDGGISGMSWSPDLELVVLTTGEKRLILMTRDFDPVMETSLTQEGFGEAELIQLGWGKKETQFHGSEGKKAALKTNDQLIKPALSWDDHCPRISWRGDGQFFAVSLVHPLTGIRQIRIWTRDGVLHSTSEHVEGLGQSLCYKPSGSVIASSLQSHDKHLIVFFEKNGLRHGEFALPFAATDIKVLELSWNLDSAVLAVWCEDLPSDDLVTPKSYVQLWTCSNYHWYLKQSLEFSALPEDKVKCFTWDTESAYRLHIFHGNNQYRQYNFSWVTDGSNGQTKDDLASVAVIDGDRVLMTPFRQMVVPPPFCAYQLKLQAPASMVSFGISSYSNDIIVLTNDNQLMLFAFSDKDGNGSTAEVESQSAGGNGFAVRCCLPRLKAVISLTEELVMSNCGPVLSHLTCVCDNSSFVVCLVQEAQTILMLISVAWDMCKVTVKSRVSLPKLVMGISLSQESCDVAIQLSDGVILRYDPESDVLSSWLDHQNRVVQFPYACLQMAICTIGGQEVVLGLTERYRFYVNDVEIANNCSSFAVHDEFLLLTTHAHTCRCICRKMAIEALPSLLTSKAYVFDETIRRVERGSRIVSAVAEDTKLILQMPRGNLESVHPRALVLSEIRKHLDQLEFGEAFGLAKKHRISMNLLYDHSPSTFLANVQLFVTQLDTVNNINLFLTDLGEDDVTVMMYTFAYGQRSCASNHAPPQKHPSKLDTISDNLRETLEKMNEEKYLLSILTTYVKKSNPDLESALQKIKSIKEKNFTLSYNDALEYLLYLVDVNRLYDVALGLYDFDLVLMVAEKSQKDPKEYLTYLNELRKMELNYQRYSIDLKLMRYSKALHHISKCGKEHFKECMELVTNHGLYQEALSLYPPKSSEYKDISIAFGDYLGKAKHYQEAGLIYWRAGESAKALEMFELSTDWKQAMCMASQLSYSTKELNELSCRLARKLKDSRRHAEAALLLEQYSNDYEEAIVTLISGCQWSEALRLMHKYNRTDFIETDLKLSLIEAYDQHKVLFESTNSEFCRHCLRLEEVRKQKASKSEAFDFMDVNNPDADLYSDTTSVTGDSVISSQSSRPDSQRSGHSRSSGRTVKSRMKHEKKKWSLREGSPYEEEALIEVLHKTASQAENWKEDVTSLLQMLVLFHKDAEAAELQSQFEQLLLFIEKSIPEIWTPTFIGATDETSLVFGPESTTNSITKDLQCQKSLPQISLRLGPELQVPPVINKSKEWKMTVLSQNKKN